MNALELRSIRSKRGQAFLKKLLAALRGLKSKALIYGEYNAGDDVCALGCVAKSSDVDFDQSEIERAFGISSTLHNLIFEENDRDKYETPEARYKRMVRWTRAQILPESNTAKPGKKVGK